MKHRNALAAVRAFQTRYANGHVPLFALEPNRACISASEESERQAANTLTTSTIRFCFAAFPEVTPPLGFLFTSSADIEFKERSALDEVVAVDK